MSTAQPSALSRPRRSLPLGIALLVAAVFALVMAMLPSGSQGVALASSHDGHRASSVAKDGAAAKLHDDMRKLWEDHIAWTRLAIVTFAADSGGFGATAERLLQNQTDIGNAIKPYYGDAAGAKLTELLNGHILIAVEVLQAAKAGDTAAFDDANARWNVNGSEIADFLSAANPKNWPQDVMRSMMQGHLDQTLAEAAHELGGDFAASVADYEVIHTHMLAMADALSAGIVKQFPRRFR